MALHLRTKLVARNKLALAIIFTGVILVGELVGGYLANSLALLSDAGHVFTDMLALLLSWFALRQAEKPATNRMTFGYHRIGIFAAFINAVSLVGIAVVILFEASHRLRSPEPVRSTLMLSIAAIGLIANLIVLFMLRSEQHGNLNIRSAFLHVAGDALASVGVIFGGVIIYFSGWFWVDPAISVAIALIIIFGAWRVIREAVNVFLEATPAYLNIDEMVQAMMEVPGVKDVHDLHVWSITPQMHALSCHVLVDDLSVSQGANIVGRLNELLSSKFSIGHSTMQLECVGCEPNSLYCSLTPHPEEEHPYISADN
jgi:cobalt-zinc-cadmium efflux system protein